MNPSFPHRMAAVIARIVLAVVEDLPAFVADVACLVAVPVSLWLLHRLIVRTAAWIGQHVRRDALDREYAELCAAAGADDPAVECLPGVTHLGRPTPPPLRRPVRRRRMPGVRIPRRPRARRYTPTSSSFDRRTR